jgi:hypothetical protein
MFTLTPQKARCFRHNLTTHNLQKMIYFVKICLPEYTPVVDGLQKLPLLVTPFQSMTRLRDLPVGLRSRKPIMVSQNFNVQVILKLWKLKFRFT